MRSKGVGFLPLVLAFTCLGGVKPAKADFLFFLDNPTGYASTLSNLAIPQENVLFNLPGLTTTGTLIQGETSTSEIIDFSAPNVLTVPAIGQAKIMAPSGNWTSLVIAPDNPLGSFQALSLNINLPNDASGSVTLGAFSPRSGFQPASVDLGPGLSFLGVIATNGDLFSVATLTSSVPILDVSQVRVSDPTPAVPEPAGLVLAALGTGLLGAPSLRRWARPARLA